MRSVRAKAVLLLLGGLVALGLVALAWAIGPGPSEADQGAMHNCPQPSKWAMSAWDGPDGTETSQALDTCGVGAVDAAYWVDPGSNKWLRYFNGRPEISDLLTLDSTKGIIIHGAVGAPLPTPTPTPTTGPHWGNMYHCPQPGRWAISVWGGPDGTDADQAMETCEPAAVDFAYYLDPVTNKWLRYFDGRPEISTLLTLDHKEAAMAHAATGAPKGFSVSNYSDYGNSWLDVVGEVMNDNVFDAESVWIDATFFDEADNMVATAFAYSCLHVLPAGGDSPFHIDLADAPANIARYTLQAYGRPADEPPPSGLDVSVTSVDPHFDHLYYVFGFVTNNSSETYGPIKICEALYNAPGDIIRAGSTYAFPTAIGPGQSATFHFDESIDSTPVASYRVWVGGRMAP